MAAQVLLLPGTGMGLIAGELQTLGARVRVLAPSERISDAYRWATHLVLPGGYDVHPACYGARLTWTEATDPELDELELDLARRCLADGKPLLGICRGHQIIAVAAGGTLVQDIERVLKVPHEAQYHRVRVLPRSRLGEIAGARWYRVNSLHHQAVDAVPDGWRVVAESPDAVIEAIEHPELPVLSVQWHPELLRDAVSERLFAEFLSWRAIS